MAALLSPVLWKINQPDRFDIYSAGIVLMQLAFPNLRSDSNLIAFRNKLEDCDHDISIWRDQVERKGSQYAEGFALLDAQGGWDLLSKVCTPPGLVSRCCDVSPCVTRGPAGFAQENFLGSAAHT